MSSEKTPGAFALETSERVLQLIYGDDLKDCRVSIEAVAAVIEEMHCQSTERHLLEALTKVVEAVHVLSTPPDRSQVADTAQLQSLLGERLDAIHTISSKALTTANAAQSGRVQG